MGQHENIFQGQIALFYFMAYDIQCSFLYHRSILPWSRFLSKMGDWVTLKIFCKFKLHIFILCHNSFKAYFHNTGASYHNQFPLKNALYCCDLHEIFFKVKLQFFVSWYDIQNSYSWHRSTLPWTRFLFKMGDHENVFQGQIALLSFHGMWHWTLLAKGSLASECAFLFYFIVGRLVRLLDALTVQL